MTELFNQGYALLVGVGECAYQPLSLPVTVKDTQAIYAALIDPELCAYPNDGEHILVLNNEEATRSRILDGLKWLKEKAEIEPEATIFVYYSGHGWFKKDDNSFYLIQHDVKIRKLEDTALSGIAFTEALREIQAERLLVVIDSCHAAGMATSKDPEEADAKLLDDFDDFQRVAPSKGLIDLKQGKGRVVFTSSEGEQKSWIKKDNSMSIYTFHFLEALQGAANKPGDKVVKVSNLMDHLSKTVPTTARNLYSAEQTPHFDFDTVDFAIAKLRGDKGLPDRGWDEVNSEAQEKIRKIAEVVIKNIQGKNVVDRIIGNKNQVGDRIYYSRNDEAKRSPDEQQLLDRVSEIIEERLKELPDKVKPINLDKKWQQDQVKHPENVDINRYKGKIPDNWSIFKIFKKAAKKLLILGEPGAGKTTTMLELAKKSIELAYQQNDFPIPVLLNLASWKKDRRTMFAWLVDKLGEEYGGLINKEDVKKLLIGDKLLLMLDGLDELEESSRKSCVEAINNLLKPGELVHENQARRKKCVEAINNILKPRELVHENQPRWFPHYIVICSRLQEYKNLKIKLQLRRAICLQALSDAQIQKYLRDRQSENFWQTLQDQDCKKLGDVLSRPLFLRIVCDALQEISINELNNFTSLEERQLYLSRAYIRWCLLKISEDSEIKKWCLLKESEDSKREKKIRLLIWLAQQLQNHGQTEFFIERMQPSWLPPGTLKWYVLLVPLSIILILSLPLIGFIYINRNLTVLNISLYMLYIIGILVIAVSASLDPKIKVFEDNIVNYTFCNSNINLTNFGQMFVSFLFFAVGLLIFLSLSTIPHYGFKLICIILFSGLLIIGIARLNGHELQQKTRPNQGIRNSAINAACVAIPIAITVATGFFIKFPLQFLSSLLMIGLPLGLICALLYGGLTCIQHFILRLILRCHGHPWNYAKFLDNAVKLKLLRRVGGRYEFIHSLLKECFAKLHDMYKIK